MAFCRLETSWYISAAIVSLHVSEFTSLPISNVTKPVAVTATTPAKGLTMEIITINTDASTIVEAKFIAFRIKSNGNLLSGSNLIRLLISERISSPKCFVIDSLVLSFNSTVILFKVKIERVV